MILSSGASAATLLYFSNSKLPALNIFKTRLRFENSLILANNGRSVLADIADPYHGNRIVRALELDSSNQQQCPQGHNTARLPRYYTCAGNGIPVIMREATIATEDPTFYSNLGFDPAAMLRAAYQDLTTGQIQSGASTITQQLVKQYILNNSSVTVSRKLQEIVMAYQLTRHHPKDYILYYYLNSVYYGDRAIGVEAASQSYFHKDVSQLRLWQAAALAGMPQSPSAYDPFNSSGANGPWYTRMLQVLNYMRKRGYIRQWQEAAAERRAAEYRFRQTTTRIHDPSFVNYAIDQFTSMEQQDPYLKRQLGQRGLYDGLKIVTTLNPQLQQFAEQKVHDQIAGLTGLNVTDGALVSIDTQSSCYGCILAMVGSAHVDKRSEQINMANAPRQPGSSFKVFNYVSAFEKGLAPASTVLDGPISLPDGTSTYAPTNYDHLWHGVVTLRTALANSLNIPAVKVELWNGVGTVAKTAVRMGITDFWRDNPQCCGYSLTLGGLQQGVTLTQETAAYSAFATEGVRVPPIAFTKIVDRTSGRVLWQARNDPVLKRERQERVAPAADTYLVTSILSDNNARAMEFGPSSYLLLDRQAAAKTGTTNDYTDNWTEGYTPQIVTGVWVGNADRSHMVNSTGITGAAPIWHDFMEGAFQILHLPVVQFAVPQGVYSGTQCRIANTVGFVPSSFSLDLYAGQVLPYCSVPTVPGLDGGSAPSNYVPPSTSTYPSNNTIAPTVESLPTATPIQVAPASPNYKAPAPVNPPTAAAIPTDAGNAAPVTVPGSSTGASSGTGSSSGTQPAPPPPVSVHGNGSP